MHHVVHIFFQNNILIQKLFIEQDINTPAFKVPYAQQRNICCFFKSFFTPKISFFFLIINRHLISIHRNLYVTLLVRLNLYETEFFPMMLQSIKKCFQQISSTLNINRIVLIKIFAYFQQKNAICNHFAISDTHDTASGSARTVTNGKHCDACSI